MIIWQGWGILVFVVYLLVSLFVEFSAGFIFDNPNYYEENPYTKIIAGLITALIIHFVSNYLNSKPGQVVIDKETGEELELKNAHSLLFIPIEYWSSLIIIICGISAIYMFFN